MIIRYPTGLYESILPSTASTPGNVTYTISSEDPPRSIETFQELPIAEALRKKDPIKPASDRRDTFGELLFTVTSAQQTISASAKKSFEVGQILTFDDEGASTDFSQSITSVEIRHDTNLLDLEAVGLTPSEIEDLSKKSVIKNTEIEIQISVAMSQAGNLRVRIAENQKSINETVKVIDAVEAIDPQSPILIRLRANLASLETDRQKLIDLLNQTDQLINNLRDELLKVSQLVR